MARDTAGEQFDARRDEVPTREVLDELVAIKLDGLRARHYLTKDDVKLIPPAAKNTPDNLERAALYLRAADFDDAGDLVVLARKAIDREIVEAVRTLVMDTYGPAPDVEDLYIDPLEG